MKNIILCGFMGSGKSTLAKGLSEALGMPLIDTDEEIVRRQGRTIAEIFASDGEAFFRSLETELIKELSLKPGDNAVRAFGMDDTVVEYEITSNRVDCYSVIGIAREAAAVFGCGFKMPEVEESGNNEDINDYLKVRVEDDKLCRRYTARMVKNIKFAPSPEWMQKRLRNAGIRPINNLVEVSE